MIQVGQATLVQLAPPEALASLVHMDYLVHLVNRDALVRRIRRVRTVIKYVNHCFTATMGKEIFTDICGLSTFGFNRTTKYYHQVRLSPQSLVFPGQISQKHLQE